MLDTLWTILFCILVLSSGLLVFLKWSIKAKIFLCVSQLCLCSVLIILGFCSNQSFTTNISCIVAFIFLLNVLNKQLENFEDDIIRKTYEAQKMHEQDIIDAEDYTVLN